MKINNVIISANIIHILVCDTVYGNVLDYISLLSLMIIMHGLTPISYTLYFRSYQYFVFHIKCIENNMVSEAAHKKREEELVSTNFISIFWFASPLPSW